MSHSLIYGFLHDPYCKHLFTYLFSLRVPLFYLFSARKRVSMARMMVGMGTRDSGVAPLDKGAQALTRQLGPF